MGKLGVIGGMGPLATELLYRRIIEKTDAKCDKEHIDMIILSHASMPDRTTAIKSGETHEVFKELLSDAKMLENNGVDAIAIPCNTSHFFWKPLQAEMDIPVINMVRKTVERIKANNENIKKVGLLATDGTLYTGIYRQECEALGIECVYPDDETQKQVMNIIYNRIKAGDNGSPEDFAKIDEFMKKSGCEAAILACTELSCFAKIHSLDSFYVDALDILCEEAILMCGGKVKKTTDK